MKTNRKGFTLIELLIVVSIIGILSVALIPNLSGAPARARDAARKALLSEVATALETFNVDNGAYPDFSDADADVCLDGTPDDAISGNTIDEADFVTDYMKGVAPTVQANPNTSTCPSNVRYQLLSNGYVIYIEPETGRGGSYSLSGLEALDETSDAADAEAATGTNAYAVVR